MVSLVLGVPHACAQTAAPPPMPDAAAQQPQALGTPRSSDLGNYTVWIRSNVSPIPVARLHSWTFHVETADGRLFIPDELSVAGGMPGHGHGFPSKPSITRHLANGNFLVEGVKFNMPGEWLLKVGFSRTPGLGHSDV